MIVFSFASIGRRCFMAWFAQRTSVVDIPYFFAVQSFVYRFNVLIDHYFRQRFDVIGVAVSLAVFTAKNAMKIVSYENRQSPSCVSRMTSYLGVERCFSTHPSRIFFASETGFKYRPIDSPFFSGRAGWFSKSKISSFFATFSSPRNWRSVCSDLVANFAKKSCDCILRNAETISDACARFSFSVSRSYVTSVVVKNLFNPTFSSHPQRIASMSGTINYAIGGG
jgi:hypothetical protein